MVNNAGVVRVTAPTTDSWEQAVDDFRSMVDVNLGGTYLVGRAAIPHLIQHGGDIVNITTDHIHTCGYPIEVDHADAGRATGRPSVARRSGGRASTSTTPPSGA